MSLTEMSNEDIKFFLRVFNEFETDNNEKMKEILIMIYKDIHKSELAVKMLKKQGKIQFDFKETRKIPNNDLLEGSFVPESIKRQIKENARGVFTLKTLILNVEIKINLLLLSESSFNKLKYLEKKLLYALKQIYFCLLYKNNDVLKSLDIHLFLTDEKKVLPENKLTTIGVNECNSAVTWACAKNGSILVYREEEWKKVLLHELFHSLCLDFSVEKYNKLRSEIRSIFNIKSDFEISETYTEFWATIINSCFVSYNLLEDKKDSENYLMYASFFIQLERVFSLFQCIKVLNFMGLRYSNLVSGLEIDKSFRELLYKEETNVFAYYILKSLLLYNVVDFLNLCKKMNTNVLSFDKTPQNFSKLIKFIKLKYRQKVLMEGVQRMELFFGTFVKSYTKKNKERILKTMRMTMSDIKLK